MQVLLNLFGAIALLLWGARMVRTALERGFAGAIRRAMLHASSRPATGLGAGLGLGALLQSGTAVVVLAAGFSERGGLSLQAALAAAIGADIGVAVAAQFLSLDIRGIAPLLIFIGVIGFMTTNAKMSKNLARASVGLGLILLSLDLISEATAPIAQSAPMAALMAAIENDTPVAIAIGAALTVLVYSSLAVILLIAALTDAGALPFTLALGLVLGVNVGMTIPALLTVMQGAPAGRRVALGNLALKIASVFVLAFAVPRLAEFAASVGLENGQGIALAFLVTSVVHGVLAFPVVPLAAPLLERWLPDTSAADPDDMRPVYLEPGDKNRPAKALANTARETMRMGETVHAMRAHSLDAFFDRDVIGHIRERDDAVDALHRAATLYLADLTQEKLNEAESRHAMEIFAFATNLEHIGDIVDHNLMELAATCCKRDARFSEDGWRELQNLHRQLIDNFTLGLDVFMSRQAPLADRLLEEKRSYRQKIRRSNEQHLRRLRDGVAPAIETSSLHLDILRDFARINSHIAAAAYPILDARGG